MSDRKITLQEFIDSYKESLGIEGAEQLIKQSILQAGIYYKLDYSKEEAVRICEELKQHPGFIGIVAGIIHSRIIIR